MNALIELQKDIEKSINKDREEPFKMDWLHKVYDFRQRLEILWVERKNYKYQNTIELLKACK